MKKSMSKPVCLVGNKMELRVDPDAAVILLINKSANTAWRLDPDTVFGDHSGQDSPMFGPPGTEHLPEWEAVDTNTTYPLRMHECRKLSSTAIRVVFRGSETCLTTDWQLRKDCLAVTAVAAESTVKACTLPGTFLPESNKPQAALVPICQGVWHRDCGSAFSYNILRSGHAGWSMPFAALIGEADALLQIAADEHDARLWFEHRRNGGFNLVWLQDPCRRDRLEYDRTVLMRFTEPSAAAVAMAYRRYVQKAGALKTWDEKIAERPELEKIFGALMCFIGYCRDDSIDYAANFQRLQDMGFDRAFVYPLSIGNPMEGLKMGGREPIDIRSMLPLLQDLQYLAASWVWVEDIPPEPAENLQLDARGKHFLSWQIEKLKWFKSCPVRGVEIAETLLDGRLAGHSAQHFDVTASRRNLECYHPEHPLDRRGDALWRRKVLETATARGCAVSSEGFWGYATPSYDIGSVKLAHAFCNDWYTVPLTSLVYHDSCIHDWWECDGYNSDFNPGKDRGKKFPISGGHAREQAVIDALGGWPPNVFPFGSQYRYVEGRMPETELYSYNLEMPAVQNALALALPLTGLHRCIGRHACIDHRVFAADGSLQATVFANGIAVYANFSDTAAELPGAGRLEPMSWTAAEVL